MKRNPFQITIIVIVTIVLCTGCVGFFDATETNTKPEKKTKQQKAEDAVEAKIIESFGENGVYKGFKFGELFTLGISVYALYFIFLFFGLD